MFTIEIGGWDVVLKEEWLWNLGPITMDFKYLYMSFTKGTNIHLNGLHLVSLKLSPLITWRSYWRKATQSFTSTFGSNSNGVFDAIATLYCQENDKQQTPSNVISHNVTFLTPWLSSLLRRFMRTCVISDLTVQTTYSRRYSNVIDIGILTSHFINLHYMCAMGATFLDVNWCRVTSLHQW